MVSALIACARALAASFQARGVEAGSVARVSCVGERACPKDSELSLSGWNVPSPLEMRGFMDRL